MERIGLLGTPQRLRRGVYRERKADTAGVPEDHGAVTPWGAGDTVEVQAFALSRPNKLS